MQAIKIKVQKFKYFWNTKDYQKIKEIQNLKFKIKTKKWNFKRNSNFENNENFKKYKKNLQLNK